jgi:hypothetical protein
MLFCYGPMFGEEIGLVSLNKIWLICILINDQLKFKTLNLIHEMIRKRYQFLTQF